MVQNLLKNNVIADGSIEYCIKMIVSNQLNE